ncbi:MAG: putative inorganic carbon transporter subunit DabA, partial [Gammaproteobacteria bacterium]
MFRLAQHLGICGADIRDLDAASVRRIFASIDALEPERTGYIWLQAYERHYREQLFNALVSNHGRGRWPVRNTRPEAQLVFCMDDREEGIRRHLEEHQPQIETLGAAGFFGLPIYWRDLDDSTLTPLCPVVVTPSHQLHETPQAGQEQPAAIHAQRRAQRLRLKDVLHQETRRNLLRTMLLILLAAPATLAVLVGKVLAPLPISRLSDKMRNACH